MAVHFRLDGSLTPDESSWPCLAGATVNPELQPSLEFHLEPRGPFPLVFAGTLSLSAIAFALRAQPDLLSPYPRLDSGEFLVLFACVFLSVIPLGIAVSWFLERLLMVRAVVTIGSLDPNSGAYNFADRNGAGYGGTRKLLPIHPADNICLVFYSPANPERNKSSSSLAFHQLVIHPAAIER